MKAYPNRTHNNGAPKIARLKLREAQISLQCANAVAGTKAIVLLARSVSEYENLFRQALSEAGITAEVFDPYVQRDILKLIDALKQSRPIFILEDPAFRAAPFSMNQLTWIGEKRSDVIPIVVRVGSAEGSEDIEFRTICFETLHLVDETDWDVVPLFLMEELFRNR